MSAPKWAMIIPTSRTSSKTRVYRCSATTYWQTASTSATTEIHSTQNHRSKLTSATTTLLCRLVASPSLKHCTPKHRKELSLWPISSHPEEEETWATSISPSLPKHSNTHHLRTQAWCRTSRNNYAKFALWPMLILYAFLVATERCAMSAQRTFSARKVLVQFAVQKYNK